MSKHKPTDYSVFCRECGRTLKRAARSCVDMGVFDTPRHNCPHGLRCRPRNQEGHCLPCIAASETITEMVHARDDREPYPLRRFEFDEALAKGLRAQAVNVWTTKL